MYWYVYLLQECSLNILWSVFSSSFVSFIQFSLSPRVMYWCTYLLQLHPNLRMNNDDDSDDDDNGDYSKWCLLRERAMKRAKRSTRSTKKHGRMECIFFSPSKPRHVLDAVLAFFFRGEIFHCFFQILYSNIKYFREFYS